MAAAPGSGDSTPQVSPSPTASSSTQTPIYPGQDCLACRLTGSATFTGIGGYALYQAHQQGAFRRIRPKGAPIVSAQITAAIGVVFVGLGLGRLVI